MRCLPKFIQGTRDTDRVTVHPPYLQNASQPTPTLSTLRLNTGNTHKPPSSPTFRKNEETITAPDSPGTFSHIFCFFLLSLTASLPFSPLRTCPFVAQPYQLLSKNDRVDRCTANTYPRYYQNITGIIGDSPWRLASHS